MQIDNAVFLEHFFNSPKKGFKYLLGNGWGDSVFEQLIKSVSKKIPINKMILSWIASEVPSQPFAVFLETKYHDEFKRIVKEQKLFNSRNYYPLVKHAFAGDTVFIAELEFWKKIWEELESEIHEAKLILAKYNFEELLILCGIYYDKMRLVYQIQKNQDFTLIESMTLILNQKLQSIQSHGKKIKRSYSPEKFRAHSIILLVRTLATGDSEIQRIFDVFDKKAELRHLYEFYSFQSFKFEVLTEKSAVLRPEDESSYLKFKKTNERYNLWHSYFHNRSFWDYDELTESLENSGMSWYNKLSHYRSWEQFDQFTDAGFSEVIDFGKNESVEVLKCFLAVNAIGTWSNIRWNNFIETEIFNDFRGDPYEFICELMEYNIDEFGNDAMPVFCRNYKELVETASEIHHFELEEIDQAYAIYTTNLNLPDPEPLDFSQKPFIKIGSAMYWVAGIMANKNYSVMLHNMLSAEDTKAEEKGPRVTCAIHAEKQLNKWFEMNSYTCKPNYDCFWDAEQKNKAGEIDLLAYKNKTLFVCQVKSTFHRSTIAEIHQHFTDERSGIAKAKSQLKRDVGFIKSKWQELSHTLSAECTLDELVIVPLAVTTTLEPGEGSFQIGDVTGYIVPLFELRVILTNTKFYLFNISELALRNKFGENIPVEYLRPLYGIKDSSAIEKQITEIVMEYAQTEKLQFSLKAEGHKHCEPDDLIHAIINESVWDMVPEPGPLQMRSLVLGDSVLNYMR